MPPGTKVLLVMSGGGGQDLPWPYMLAKRGIGEKLHVVVIAGGNNELAPNLRKALPRTTTFSANDPAYEREVWLGVDPTVTVEVATDPAVPDHVRVNKPYYVFEDRLALLMDMADAVISKPGGGSTSEIAYRGVPAIFDTATTLFHWETFTVNVFARANRAIAFNSKEQDVRDAIRSAIQLGHSLALVQDDRGEMLVTSQRIVSQAKKLLFGTACSGCALFSSS